MDAENSLGQYLRSLRKGRSLSLRQVEDQTKISNGYLSQLERGKRGIPNWKILKKLADAYEIKLTDMVAAVEKVSDAYLPPPPEMSDHKKFLNDTYDLFPVKKKYALVEYLMYLDEPKVNKLSRRVACELMFSGTIEASVDPKKGKRKSKSKSDVR